MDQSQHSPAEKRRGLALQYAACFQCLVEEWHDCEELKPKPKEKWTFIDREVQAKSIEWSGVRLQATTVA